MNMAKSILEKRAGGIPDGFQLNTENFVDGGSATSTNALSKAVGGMIDYGTGGFNKMWGELGSSLAAGKKINSNIVDVLLKTLGIHSVFGAGGGLLAVAKEKARAYNQAVTAQRALFHEKALKAYPTNKLKAYLVSGPSNKRLWNQPDVQRTLKELAKDYRQKSFWRGAGRTLAGKRMKGIGIPVRLAASTLGALLWQSISTQKRYNDALKGL
jgi:hypothetical protein